MPEPLERLAGGVCPPPSEVRLRLADNLAEANLLRRLLRVAEDVACERQQRRAAPSPRPTAAGREGDRGA
jgi:hypothetical protein